MKCPSCGYVSFDELNHCKKCGADLTVQEREEGAFSFDESDFEEIVTPLKENEAPGKDEWQLEEISLEGEAAGLAKAKPPAAPAAPPPPRKAGRKANAETVQTQPAPAEPAGDKPVEAESSPAAAEKSQADVIFEKIFDQWETAEPVKPEPPPPPPVDTAPPPVVLVPERAPEEFLLDDFRIDLEEPAVAPASWEMPGALGKEEAPAAAWREPQEEVLPLQNLEEVPEAFRGEEPAGFFRRAPAFLVDSLLVCFILLLFVVGAGVALSLKGAPTAWLLSRFWPADALLPFFILAALINGVYFIVSHWLKGRTLGKRLFSLRLIDQDGGPPTLSAAIFHWMGYLVSAVPLGLGFWWALFDQDRFTWHDRLSGTMVVVDSGKTAPA